MNATNRAVNRIVLLIGGLVLLAAGAAALAVATIPVAADAWTSGIESTTEWIRDAHAATLFAAQPGASWLVVGVFAVLAAIVVIGFIVLAHLGGGRSGIVIRDDAGTGVEGPVTLRNGFAADAITGSLARQDEILTSRVSARRVRGREVLHVSITPRQNTSPVDIAETVARLVDNLAVVSGRKVPTLVSIRSGVRARMAAEQSRVG